MLWVEWYGCFRILSVHGKENAILEVEEGYVDGVWVGVEYFGYGRQQ